MESEKESGGLVCRYVYGLGKAEAVIGNAGSVTQYVYADGTGNPVFSAEHPGQVVTTSNIVRLFYHQDRLETVDYRILSGVRADLRGDS